MNIEYNFWNRVDILRKNSNIKTLKDLAIATGIKEKRFKDQRSNQTLPKAVDLLAIANVFNVSMESLLTGKIEEKKAYSKRIELISNKLSLISESNLSLIEHTIDLMPIEQKSEKVNVIS